MSSRHSSNAAAASSQRFLAQMRKPGDFVHKIAVCREPHRVHAVAGKDAVDALTAFIDQLVKPRLEAGVTSIDVDLLACLGVLEDEGADGRDFFLARVGEPDCHHFMALTQAS